MRERERKKGRNPSKNEKQPSIFHARETSENWAHWGPWQQDDPYLFQKIYLKLLN